MSESIPIDIEKLRAERLNPSMRQSIRQDWNEVRWWFYWNVIRLPKNVYYFFQRGRRGYSSRDIWGLDHHLAGVIGRSVGELASYTDSCPCTIDEGFELPEEDHEARYEIYVAELKEMSEGFLIYEKDDEYSWSDEGRIKVDRSQELFKKLFMSLWT